MNVLMMLMTQFKDPVSDKLNGIKKSKVIKPLNQSKKLDFNHFHNINTRMSPNSLYLAVK